MNAIVNGKCVLFDRVLEDLALLYTDYIVGFVPVAEIPADATIIDAGGGYVMPGLIDLHIHGYAGVDATTATEDDLARMGDALLKEGVTGFLATTMTVDVPTLHTAWETCRRARKRCPNLLGVNAEGPFVSQEKCGAQDPAYAIPPNPELMLPYADVIKITTIAPELPGAVDATKALTDAGITVAIGHTNADYETAMACIDAGASHTTHLFNAMSGLNHRAPGVVGAVMNSHHVSRELIADNHHVHPALYRPVWDNEDLNLCLITDCLPAGGMPPGEYTLGKTPVHSDGEICRLADDTLAGSAGTLMRNLKNFYDATGLPLWECVNCATRNPADVLKLNKGILEPGQDADIVIVTEDFSVTTTILGGQIVYQA